MPPATAPVREIGYAQSTAHGGYWWMYEDETTPELVWPQSVNVYDSMRRTDAQVASVLRAVTLPVRRTPWRIDPNGARDEVVELIATDLGLPIVGDEAPEAPARMRDRFSWPEHLRQALLMLVFGHSYFEMTFRVDKDGNRAHLHKLSPRPAKTIERIEVARDGGLVWIKQYPAGPGGSGDSQKPIPVSALVAYIHDREGGNWLGTSVLRAAYKNSLLKDRLLRVQAQTIERNGMGIPLYTAQEGATEADITAGRDMATAWRAGEAAGSAVPFGANLVLRGVEGTLPDADPVIRYHDEQIARAVLAHFLNLGTQTGSWALGTTFADFFTLSLQTLAQQIADTATMHVIEDIVDANWGEDEPAPRLVFDEIGSRQAATAQALKSLIDAGAIQLDATLEEMLRQQYGLPPRDPETARAAGAEAGMGADVDADAMVTAIDAYRGGKVAAAAGLKRRRAGRFPRVVARFNPLQPRVPHGERGGEWTLTGLIKDILGLGDRMDDAEPGEHLIGSDKLKADFGTVRVALTDRGLRLGIGDTTFGGREDEAGPWRGGRDQTVRLNTERAPLRAEKSALETAPETAEGNRRYDELDDMDLEEVYPSGYTARLDRASVDHLRATLADAVARGSARSTEVNAEFDEIERLEALQAPLRGMSRKWTVAEEARWDDLAARVEAIRGRIEGRGDRGYEVFAEGSIPGEWADVHYRVFFDEPVQGVQVKLGAVPHGSEIDFDDMESAPTFDEAEIRKFIRLLDRIVIGAGKGVQAAAGPDFNRLHPRGRQGRFRHTFTRILDSLSGWAAAGGKGEPLPESEFSREQLRRVAVTRGVKLDRGAKREVVRDALLDNLRAELAGKGDERDEAPEPKAKPAKKAAPKKAPAKRAAPKRPKPAELVDAQLDEIQDAYRIGRPGTARGESALTEAADAMAAGENREQVALNLREHAQEMWEEWDRGNDVDLVDDPLDAPRDKTPGEIQNAVDDEWDRLNRLADALDAIDEAAERKDKAAARRPAAKSEPVKGDAPDVDEPDEKPKPAAKKAPAKKAKPDRESRDAEADELLKAQSTPDLRRIATALDVQLPKSATTKAAVTKAILDQIDIGLRKQGDHLGARHDRLSLIQEAVESTARPKGAGDIGAAVDRIRSVLDEGGSPAQVQGQILRLLAGDTGLTSAKLRKVADALDIDLPEGMRHRGSMQMHIAEHAAAKKAPAKPAPPSAEAREIEVENRIREAYRGLLGRTDLEEGSSEFSMMPGMTPQRLMRQGGYVSIADLRDELSDIPRSELDGALKRLAIHGDGISAVPESAQASLTDHQRAGALHYGDQDKHWLIIDDPSPRPLPDATPAKATPRAPAKKAAPRVNSTPKTEPPPTPPNPQSPWGKVRDNPRTRWSSTHGRPGNLDQVDAVYVAPDRDAAREYLQTRGDEQLYQIGASVDADMQGLDEKKDRRDYIERLLDVIREPEDVSTLDPESLRDSLDLKTVDALKDMIRERNKAGAKLRLSGRKRELVDRLVEDMAGGADPEPDASETPEGVADRLRQATSREEAAEMLDGLTVPQLRDVADQFSPTIAKVAKSKGNLRAEIVDYAVGLRLDFDAHVDSTVGSLGGGRADLEQRERDRREQVGAVPEAPKKRAPAKKAPAGRPPATPVPIHDLLDADDATIDAALRDVYEGQFGSYTTKVTRVGIRRAGTDSRGRPVEKEIFVEGSIFGPDGVVGGSIGKFGRSIGPAELHYADGSVHREVWAQHSIVELDEEFQGKGFGGLFNRRVIEWYRASGVHGITQDDHNFYVWASQGFDFRGGIVSQQATDAMRELIADLRAGHTKRQGKYETIPKRLRDAPDLDAQIAAAEALLARLESTSPGQPGYPTAYEISQLGRRRGQRGKTAVWFGKLIPVAADEMILNPDEGEVVSG
jgi:GNAT superfamily N-acetyltransferase